MNERNAFQEDYELSVQEGPCSFYTSITLVSLAASGPALHPITMGIPHDIPATSTPMTSLSTEALLADGNPVLKGDVQVFTATLANTHLRKATNLRIDAFEKETKRYYAYLCPTGPRT
ncbi:hypothetical protein CVT26_006426 [Gymnopilus dilepis]|uniref:Uncharacterized protein n=1 Tax=Gymnopilus dilepis TaxID=231916 RepID=A0A409Y1Z1_9AGAR|nr:hypothetical protein CVT26_006426 [Gymnopilus dilepis]